MTNSDKHLLEVDAMMASPSSLSPSPSPTLLVQVHVLRWLVPLSPASHSRESKAAKEGGQGKVTDTYKVVTDQL